MTPLVWIVFFAIYISLLALDLTESGEYRVTVTSYEKGETGGYALSIDVESPK